MSKIRDWFLILCGLLSLVFSIYVIELYREKAEVIDFPSINDVSLENVKAEKYIYISVYADKSFRTLYSNWQEIIQNIVQRAHVNLVKATGIGIKIVCYHKWDTRFLKKQNYNSKDFIYNLKSLDHHKKPAPFNFGIGFTSDRSFLYETSEDSNKDVVNSTLGISEPRHISRVDTKEILGPDVKSPSYGVIYVDNKRFKDADRVFQHELSHLLGILQHDDHSPNIMNTVYKKQSRRADEWLPEHILIIKKWAAKYILGTHKNSHRCNRPDS